MWWQFGVAANLVIMVFYLGIAGVILVPLWRTGQLRGNKLGTATGVIFFSCGIGHGVHMFHAIAPAFGIEREVGLATRASSEWHQVLWDLGTAAVAGYYWSLRATYGSLMKGAKLFEDLRDKQRQALEINDRIVQGLVVAQAALVLDQRARSEKALDAALTSAKELISDLLVQVGKEGLVEPGDLVRHGPAKI